jgi:hypothetical protein
MPTATTLRCRRRSSPRPRRRRDRKHAADPHNQPESRLHLNATRSTDHPRKPCSGRSPAMQRIPCSMDFHCSIRSGRQRRHSIRRWPSIAAPSSRRSRTSLTACKCRRGFRASDRPGFRHHAPDRAWATLGPATILDVARPPTLIDRHQVPRSELPNRVQRRDPRKILVGSNRCHPTVGACRTRLDIAERVLLAGRVEHVEQRRQHRDACDVGDQHPGAGDLAELRHASAAKVAD